MWIVKRNMPINKNTQFDFNIYSLDVITLVANEFFHNVFFLQWRRSFLIKWNNNNILTLLRITHSFSHTKTPLPPPPTTTNHKKTPKLRGFYCFSPVAITLCSIISLFCFLFVLLSINCFFFFGGKKLVGQINLLSKPLPLGKRTNPKLHQLNEENEKKHFRTKYAAMVFPVVVVVLVYVYHLFSFGFLLLLPFCVLLIYFVVVIRYSYMVAVITAIISDASSTNMLILRDW